MTIKEFYVSIKDEVKQELNERLAEESQEFAYEENVYLEMILSYLNDNQMIVGEAFPCYCNTVYKNGRIKLHAYALSDDLTQLDLFICLYKGNVDILEIPDRVILDEAVKPCQRFFSECVNVRSNFVNNLETSSEAYMFAKSLRGLYNDIKQIRIYVITDVKTKSKFFKDANISNKSIRIEILDIERYFKVCMEGKPRDEIFIDFLEQYGFGIPCVYIPQQADEEYSFALTSLPGEVIYNLYSKYKDRILEANVRSFLSLRRKNAGIQQTLIESPSRFMAYNNGLVILADSVNIKSNDDGTSSILQLQGLQIVNGGQTTATIFFAKLNNPNINLGPVRVAAKIIILGKNQEETVQEDFIGKVARYANTQTPVKESDFLAHSAFQVNFEAVSNTVYCPDSIGKWFYERATGSYNTFLSREGRTPSKRKHLITHVIPRKRLIKKTDLGQSIATWEQEPYIACLGGEKCLGKYKDRLAQEATLVDAPYFKKRIAEYLVFYHTFYFLRGDICKQSPGVVRIYLISKMSALYRDIINFDFIWLNQGLSDEFKEQIRVWGKEVYNWMIAKADGRQLSEYGKSQKSWEAILELKLSKAKTNIPELHI